MSKRSCDYVDALPEDAREIPGYPKYYATPGGEIYSGVRGRLKRKRFGRNGGGYLLVSLTLKNGSERHLLVHRVIAKMFVDGEREELTVNHKDLNKQNNTASNLEWITFSANQQHWRPFKPESMAQATANLRKTVAQAVWAFNRVTTRPVKRYEAIADAARALGLEKKLRGAMANICAAATHYGVGYGYLWRREDREGLVDMCGLLEHATGRPHCLSYKAKIPASELRPTGEEIEKVKPREAQHWVVDSSHREPPMRVIIPLVDDFA